jgi:hypothetical protein
MPDRINLVVGAAAPIAVGQEVEVYLVASPGTDYVVLVRDLSTSVLYASGSVLAACSPSATVIGWAGDYRQEALEEGFTVRQTFRARVFSCVVANVRQVSGEHEAVTSLVVEVV